MRNLLRDIFVNTIASTMAGIIVALLMVAGKAMLSMYQRAPDANKTASAMKAAHILQVLLDAGICWFFADGVFTLLRSNEPLTRIDVVMLSALTFGTLYAGQSLLLGTIKRQR